MSRKGDRMHLRFTMRRAAPACLLAAMLGGCGTYIPQSGPTRDAIISSSVHGPAEPVPAPPLPYALVRLDATTLPLLGDPPAEQRFSFAPPPAGRRAGAIGVGDELGVTIFEADSGGLFITGQPEARSGNAVTLPSQQVDKSGRITVPFAGSVVASGLTPSELGASIARRLSGRALEPQVIVSVLGRKSGAISVLGEVGGATRFSLDPEGEHLLGALARAGGSRFPDYETVVSVRRDGRTQQSLLSEVARDPGQDIALQGGDSIFVTHRTRYFLALGATGQSASLGPLDRRIAFGDSHLTLADALARAGGLQDDRANPRAVFVYRLEDGATAASLGAQPAPSLGGRTPLVFLADLREPAGYFYASGFAMRPEDVIFVSNAPATDLAKFLSLVTPLAGTATTAAVIR